ncbi:hypothetical protein LLH06_19190 [Mucilaginibacter daejeonensis]|uniref:hypothetical protein n=1 Tax=Mucilaginibacter daejeonensis TaxID=398049 RepID=UPI001D17993C|nr:hypothetical protein [Mucilaginibacter daejeonensis]UEG53074.1 hypothetical protein LLH06_19190 [Mucilaginibacter daejeonensis]
MTDSFKNTTDGKYEFTINYSERELTCHVEREGDILHVRMDNNIIADLELQPDGTAVQISGDELPDSSIEFIKKQVLDQE